MSQTAIETGIYSKLAGLGANFGIRIYAQQAPLGATMPYCVFAYVGGGDTNISQSRIVDVDYQIEVISTNLAEARAGSDALDTALHDGMITVGGWNLIAVTRGSLFQRVENVEGKQYWRRGADYRIRISK